MKKSLFVFVLFILIGCTKTLDQSMSCKTTIDVYNNLGNRISTTSFSVIIRDDSWKALEGIKFQKSSISDASSSVKNETYTVTSTVCK